MKRAGEMLAGMLTPQRNLNPFNVVRDFEQALAYYTGARHAVTTTSCTMALQMAVAWRMTLQQRARYPMATCDDRPLITIPARTYIGVPMAIVHAGARPVFDDISWVAYYQLQPIRVYDSARWFTQNLHQRVGRGHADAMVCVSFHWAKTLGLQQGGAILTDDAEAAAWLRRARFDGRTEGVPPAHDRFDMLGWHAYMSPEVAALGLVRLWNLPLENDPLPNDPYPDLSTAEVFK